MGKSYYGHLSKISVAEGEMIARGGAIGLSGNTGLSTGPHLHFGVKPNSAQMDNGYYGKVDPAPYLDFRMKAVYWELQQSQI